MEVVEVAVGVLNYHLNSSVWIFCYFRNFDLVLIDYDALLLYDYSSEIHLILSSYSMN